jgi:hypothetical protein
MAWLRWFPFLRITKSQSTLHTNTEQLSRHKLRMETTDVEPNLSSPTQTTPAAVTVVAANASYSDGTFDGCSTSSLSSDGDWEASTSSSSMVTRKRLRKVQQTSSYIDTDSDSSEIGGDDAEGEPQRKKTSHQCAFCSASCSSTESSFRVSQNSSSGKVYIGGKITELELTRQALQNFTRNANLKGYFLVACKSCCDWQMTCVRSQSPT